MIAKLIKTGKDKYHIESDKFDGIHLACYPHDITKQKLSLENCKTIEKGYDLKELVNDFDLNNISESRKAFKYGFQKALQIIGDKQYTKENMINAYHIGTNDGVEYESFVESGAFEDFDELEKYEKEQEHEFQNWLERKEWNVEIKMETISDGLDEMAQPQFSKIPKLDADGCLILKRK